MTFDKKAFITELTRYQIATFPIDAGQKKATLPGWDNALPGQYNNDITEKSNYGIIIPPKYLIVDADLYKPHAQDSFNALVVDGLPTNTFTCRTARGGFHYWYRLTPNACELVEQGSRIDKNQPKYLGIDFLASHGNKEKYIVGAGSSTPDGEYEVVWGSLAEIVYFPDALFNELVRDKTISERKSLRAYEEIAGYRNEALDYERFVEYLASQSGVADGEGREAMAYAHACTARDYGLLEQETFNCLRDHWNDKNEPPLSLAKLAEKTMNAYKYANDVQGNASVQINIFDSFRDTNTVVGTAAQEVISTNPDIVPAYDDRVFGEWDIDLKNGKLRATARNLRRIFQLETISTTSYTFQGLFAYDLLGARITLTRKPFWRALEDTSPLFLNEYDLISLKFFLTNQLSVEYSTLALSEACAEAARRNAYHPVRKYLESLEWDGNSRLKHLFLEYFEVLPEENDAEDNEYRELIAQAFILAAIERAYNPGCKFDEVIVLAGRQGTYKSEFVSVLGGENTAVVHQMESNFRSLQAMQGAWFIEFPEISASKKTDVDNIKAFLSVKTDKFIPLHGKTGVQWYPRQWVGVWTVNPPPEGFLKDITGERRFIIVEVPHIIDINAIREDRDHIFAEAMELYRAGKTAYHFMAQAFKGKQLTRIQKRYKQDEHMWLDTIRQYILDIDFTHENRVIDHKAVSWDIVWTDDLCSVLGIHRIEDRGIKVGIQIARVMTFLGWERYRGASKRGWRRQSKLKTKKVDDYDEL